MARFDPILTSFTAGEFSPLALGRVDIDKYEWRRYDGKLSHSVVGWDNTQTGE